MLPDLDSRKELYMESLRFSIKLALANLFSASLAAGHQFECQQHPMPLRAYVGERQLN
jgi:hypothetical protein